MANKKLRVGVIGVGRMGERHCRVYSQTGGVEFVGVSDVSPTRGRAIAGAYDVVYCEDFRDLLANVDAVSVATPTESHFAVAAECLSRQVHVLVEKPMAANVDEGEELVRLARQSSAIFQVGHIERFNPVFLELRGILADLEVVALSARRLSPFDTSNTDIDVVADLMIHDIDLALALLGTEVSGINAFGRSARTGGMDYAVANLCMTGGPVATLTASRVTEQKVRFLEITALGAYVEADLLNKSICIYRRTFPEYLTNHQRPLRYRQEGLVERIHIPTAEPLMLELQDFARCAREVCPTKVTAEDGLRAIQMATRIRALVKAETVSPVAVGVAS